MKISQLLVTAARTEREFKADIRRRVFIIHRSSKNDPSLNGLKHTQSVGLKEIPVGLKKTSWTGAAAAAAGAAYFYPS